MMEELEEERERQGKKEGSVIMKIKNNASLSTQSSYKVIKLIEHYSIKSK